MGTSILTIKRFKELFAGNMSYKGITKINSIAKENEKLEVNSYLEKKPVTNQDITDHLEGRQSIGLSPINEEGLCAFGVIDVDDYSPVVKKRLKNIYRYGIPLIPFYSKSGGLHLYVFFKEPVKPDVVKDILDELKLSIGLPANTEVFPKQRSKDNSSFGSWINLPYFAADDKDNKRKLVKEDGKLACLAEALDYCESKKVTTKELKAKLEELPLYDAPPCLQSLYISGVDEYRNEFLFSAAVYCKNKYGEDQFEQELLAINSTFEDPLSEKEVHNTIIKTMNKKTYSYKCGMPPLCNVCNKKLCESRQFGKDSGQIPSLSFEEFHQYLTEPPYYEWIVNGQALRFYKEEDIINQTAFRTLCMRKLHKLPKKLSDAKWTSIVNSALENVILHEADIESSMTAGGMWYKYTCDFFSTRKLADTQSQIKLGRIYKDEEMGCYIFRGTDYIEFMTTIKDFKGYSEAEMQNNLIDKGAKIISYLIGEREYKVWAIPVSSIDTQQDSLQDMEINYLDTEKEDDRF
jgi:hypothetical protein